MFRNAKVVDVRDGYCRRLARLAMGIVLLVGVGAIVRTVDADSTTVASAFAMTWLGAIATYAIAYGLAFTFLPWEPPHRVPRWLDYASIATVFAAASLLLPLTLHLVIAWLFWRVDGLRVFGGWVGFVLPVTAFGHVLAASLVGVRACRLVAGRRVGDPARIVLWLAVAAAMPTFAFVLMPQLIVIPLVVTAIAILTSMATIFPMLRWLDASVARDAADRAAIGTLPTAIVHAG